MKPWKLLGSVIVVMCVLSGCTSVNGPAPSTTAAMPDGGSGVPNGSSSSSTGSGSGFSGPLPQASMVTMMDPPPPLAKYATDLEGPSPDASAIATMQDWYNNIQNSISACMAAQGFRYVPNPHDVSQTSTGLSSPLLSLPVPFLPSERDMVAHVGYGVMGTPDEQAAAAGEVEDPNVTYRETLSPAEQDAYDKALYGDPSDPIGTSGASCSGQAQAQYPEPNQPDKVQAFQTEFDDLMFSALASVSADARAGGLNQDPRAVQLDGQWESCMNSKGYVFEKVGSESGPMLAMDLAMRTRPDGTVGPAHYGVPASEIPPEEISLLGTEPEREVALADFDCRVATNYMAQLTSIRVSRDEDFIQQHQADFDKLEAAAETW